MAILSNSTFGPLLEGLWVRSGDKGPQKFEALTCSMVARAKNWRVLDYLN